MLTRCASGFGALALAALHADQSFAGQNATISAPGHAGHGPHHRVRAKRVGVLYMDGGPSQVDTFDPKPMLDQYHGQDPARLFDVEPTQFNNNGKVLASPWKFRRYGKSGIPVSELFPHIAQCVDELAVIRSLTSEFPEHTFANYFLHTGSGLQGRPSMGAWVNYGLGSECQNLPGFVVLNGGLIPPGGLDCFGSGFLPSVYQGVQCRSSGDPVLYVSDPKGMDRETRRLSLDAIKELNEIQAQELGHPETRTRISQYELAYRMQTSVPEVMDISKEPAKVIEAYGAKPGASSFANNCLLARRLIEQGTRYVQLFDWGWDFHGTNPKEDIRDGLTQKCATVDKPIAALIKELKDRSMLDETLIICGGEFGRTPFREGRTAKGKVLGRDHYPDCYSMWMAGGGVKGSYTYGESDDLGFSVAENPVGVHDFQATLMHLLGFDHERLTYRFQGRDYRLTDVHGHVIDDIVA